MQILKPENSTVLGKPKDWDEEKNGPCEGLPVVILEDGMYSLWKPDEQEIDALRAGGSICLKVGSHAHPPVSIYVTSYPGDVGRQDVSDPEPGEHQVVLDALEQVKTGEE